MESSRIRTWSEGIGLAAVIASLVFVGLEVRQNAEATRAATAQHLSEGWLQWNLTMADPAAWSAVSRMFEFNDISKARFEDRAAVSSLMRTLFWNWSNLYWHYLRGDLDPELWDAVRRNIEGNLLSTSERDADWRRLLIWGWEVNRHMYHEKFQKLFDEMRVRSGA